MLLATDVADYLVLKGLPFRQAHEVVGKLVAESLRRDCPLPDLPFAVFQDACDRFEPDVKEIFSVTRSLEKRTAYGATAPRRVKEQLQRWKDLLQDEGGASQ
jgi:argininosuccinate lyase